MDTSTCRCGGVMTLDRERAFSECDRCRRRVRFIEHDAASLSFDARIRRRNYVTHTTSYRPVAHLREVLNKLQFRESTSVSKDVLMSVISYLWNAGHSDAKSITYSHVIAALRELGLSNVYDRSVQVYCLVTDKPPPVLVPANEKRMLEHIQKMEQTYSSVCPDTRSNFFNSRLVLVHLAFYLGYYDLLPFLQCLRAHDNLVCQEKIMAATYERLKWPFKSLKVHHRERALALCVKNHGAGTVKQVDDVDYPTVYCQVLANEPSWLIASTYGDKSSVYQVLCNGKRRQRAPRAKRTRRKTRGQPASSAGRDDPNEPTPPPAAAAASAHLTRKTAKRMATQTQEEAPTTQVSQQKEELAQPPKKRQSISSAKRKPEPPKRAATTGMASTKPRKDLKRKGSGASKRMDAYQTSIRTYFRHA